jgi:hypothetical protein
MQGRGGGPFPGVPFGFEGSLAFAKQSESLLFFDPHLVTVRTRVLDYFSSLRPIIPAENTIFRWEQSMRVRLGE